MKGFRRHKWLVGIRELGMRVTQPFGSNRSFGGTLIRLVPNIGIVVMAAISLAIIAIYVPDPVWTFGLGMTSAILFVLGIAAAVLRVQMRLQRRQLRRAVSAFVEHDASPSFIADDLGEVSYRNAAAGKRFGDHPIDTLPHAFNDLFANPSAVLFRMQSAAQIKGAAREDIVTRRGHVRLAAHRMSDTTFLWRLEDIGERAGGGRGADALSLPMLTAGPSGTVLFMNEAFRRLMGGRVKTLDRIFRDLPLASGQVHEVDGADGTVSCLVATVEGVGGRKEVYLLPSNAASGAATSEWSGLESLPVPLLKIGPSGEILASNKDARALLHTVIKDGARLSEVLTGLGRPMTDWLKEAAEGRGLHQPEFLKANCEEQEVFIQIALNRVFEDEKPVLVAVLNDVTELKTLEAQFVQSQKMQAIGQLAGGVAHDFNNLLTAISGHCDLLLLRHDQGDQDYSDLVQINQNANRAASLVGQLLAFSRKQNLRPEMLDLRDTLSDLTHLLNRLVGEKVSLSLEHDPELRPIRADKRQLEQVLMNLVVNARDAMPEGGEIKVKTECKTLTQPYKRDRAVIPVGDYVIVKVTDEGHGISADKIPKIFEPFYTTKRTGEGTGLGLSTAYGIVKQSGGFIFADSISGNGTVFTLFFPSHEALIPVIAQPVDALETDMSKKAAGVVLLVEDEAPVRAFASRALRLRGYTVLEADCAEAALDALRDKSLEVDIFVTDVVMPGMDGPSWVKEALIDRPDTKVVFVSGYAEDAFGEDQTTIPNSVFLPKPFSLNDLTATVQRQLH
jgi:two-component system cell cycle sensor histidine kinase/response regulator CckA